MTPLATNLPKLGTNAMYWADVSKNRRLNKGGLPSTSPKGEITNLRYSAKETIAELNEKGEIWEEWKEKSHDRT